MTTTLLLAVLAKPATAEEGASTRLGVGAETMLTTPFGTTGAATFVLDLGDFRFDTLLFLLSEEDAHTSFGIGGRFHFVLHSSDRADFSGGVGAALAHTDPERGSSTTRVFIEGACQLRFFVVESVALSATLGLGFAVGDGPFIVGLGGQLTGGFGVTYFF